MNPEFQRNLWLEFSTQRLIAMPVILFATFCVVYLLGDVENVKHVALIALVLLLVVWGAGLASDAIFQEIEGRTWDTQRMTPLGPWRMAWGKLLGSTLYVWYGAFWCVVTIFAVTFNATQSNTLLKTGYYLLTGVSTQAFALFFALLIQRISPLRSRFKIVLIQIASVIISLTFFYAGYSFLPSMVEKISWYYFNFDPVMFVISWQLFFTGCLILGIYRLIRTELQIKTFPWVWPLFVIILCIYLIGFVTTKPAPDFNKTAFYSSVAYFVFLPMTFIAAFFTPKSVVYLKRTLMALKMSQGRRLLSLTPVWIIGLFITLILGLTTLYLLPSAPFEKLPYSGSALQIKYAFTGLIISLFWFLLRDIGILYLMTLYPRAKRAHLATVVYLAFLYTILPMLLSLSSIFPHFLLYAFAPWVWFSSLDYWTWDVSFVTNFTKILEITSLVLIQAILAWIAVLMRWRSSQQQLMTNK